VKRVIDCLFIGYNECIFEKYEKRLRAMGEKTIDYKDINMNFIQYNNKLYTPSDIFNLFYDYNEDSLGPLSMTDTFSLTIAYLGSFLHRKGFSFDYILSYQKEKNKLIDMLSSNNILSVAIPTTYYTSIFPILEIVSFIKNYNPSVRIIIGGPFIANCAALGNDILLNNLYRTVNADFYIYDSQGEHALSQKSRLA
jgi:anaerobic magnesium-protoporphyrin IX monomethyl ester cyclase